MGIGDWGLGIGDWGLGIGPNPQSPIPNPQSPIPNPHVNKIIKYFQKLKLFLRLKIYIIKNFILFYIKYNNKYIALKKNNSHLFLEFFNQIRLNFFQGIIIFFI